MNWFRMSSSMKLIDFISRFCAYWYKLASSPDSPAYLSAAKCHEIMLSSWPRSSSDSTWSLAAVPASAVRSPSCSETALEIIIHPQQVTDSLATHSHRYHTWRKGLCCPQSSGVSSRSLAHISLTRDGLPSRVPRTFPSSFVTIFTYSPLVPQFGTFETITVLDPSRQCNLSCSW